MFETHKEEQEYIGTVRKDKVLDLQEMIRTGIFRTIINSPKEIEFRLKPGYDYVSVIHKGDFICYITKEQYTQIVDDDSVINTHFQKTYDNEIEPIESDAL